MTDTLRTRIAAAKERFAAIPEWRRQELIAGFNKAQQAALFHLHYRRPTMPDNLRDRIAAVICGMDALHAQQWSFDVADAVIRDLPELQARCNCQQRNWADRGSIDREHLNECP